MQDCYKELLKGQSMEPACLQKAFVARKTACGRNQLFYPYEHQSWKNKQDKWYLLPDLK